MHAGVRGIAREHVGGTGETAPAGAKHSGSEEKRAKHKRTFHYSTIMNGAFTSDTPASFALLAEW